MARKYPILRTAPALPKWNGDPLDRPKLAVLTSTPIRRRESLCVAFQEAPPLLPSCRQETTQQGNEKVTYLPLNFPLIIQTVSLK
jgi:hypothetical protein